MFNLFYFDGESPVPAPSAAAEAEQDSAAEGVGTREESASALEQQPQGAPEVPEGESSQEQAESYRKFKEQFKDLYQADVQRIIDKRFKNAKKVEAQRDALKSENEQYQGLLSALEDRYGTRDLEELGSRIAQPESAAPQEGAVQAEAQEAQEALPAQEQIVENWQKEAAALAELYPAFSLESEIDNEKFAAALQSGMSMRDAYQLAHFDEILSGVIAYTAQNVKDAVAHKQQQRMARPAENGTHAGAAAIVKNDVSKLSRQEMEDIDRRVLRGERISF